MKKFLIYGISCCFLLGIELDEFSKLRDWVNLQEKPVKIDWLQNGDYPYSRAQKIFNFDILKISHMIQDLDLYPNIFKRVMEIDRLEKDVVKIMLKMPFPFARRDYIVKYKIKKTLNQWIFSFKAIEHPNGLVEPGIVRLNNASGIWVLKKLSENKTHVTYSWNGELLGNFPDFGLKKAWITQGTEVLNWLGEALSNKN
ncbi:MAG: hypothetical protein CMG60_04590 [Candidatus Marinimicrobia bacterium]|nr:hypothetical protein [Candidatus Neomarinimicrobiota bacterium]|tara:strand:- start:269 stop:865 length:597 start_codon:yes stop_codon:yes gene_type:complete